MPHAVSALIVNTKPYSFRAVPKFLSLTARRSWPMAHSSVNGEEIFKGIG